MFLTKRLKYNLTMAHQTMKHDAPSTAASCDEDYHLSYKYLLRQRLSQDIKTCFKLGTKTNAGAPQRSEYLCAERIPKKKTLTGTRSSHVPKEAKDLKHQKSAKKPLLLKAMQEYRKTLKGHQCTNVKKHLEKNASYGCTQPMVHSINEQLPCKQIQEDLTSHHNFGSVNNGLKHKQILEVLEPGAGYQNASSRSSHEVPILTSFVRHEAANVQKHHLSANYKCTPMVNDSCEGQTSKHFRKHGSSLSPQHFSEHQSSKAKPLINPPALQMYQSPSGDEDQTQQE
ncbi:uncharacterized protein [Misgurnus anguillicaudatus]|uniref:uncharacterized protein n=1 Tax=Misgurnus anguillicaudatus TaxID=75329 RepID=UPI003CCFAED2